MQKHQAMLRFTENCDIYFEDALISKELIIERYSDFLTALIASNERTSSVALHTGSVCFDIVSFIVVAIACISMDQNDSDDVIASLSDGDMVLYNDERYRWRGFETIDERLYIVIEQAGRGKHGASKIISPYDKVKGLITPYYGASELTDGRGIRKRNPHRSGFISYVTGKNYSEIPSITGVSAVIVADRASFERIHKGLSIRFGRKKISLLDIVPAAYYTDGDEPYQFGSNPSKTEPVLKITSKVSIARDLVLDKRGSKVIGLMVVGAEAAAKGFSELEDLLGRRSLKFTHISMSVDSENAEQYVNDEGINSFFACTKEFLLQHSKPVAIPNILTNELDRQVENIINNEVKTELIIGGYSWDVYRKIRNALFVIKQSDWAEEHKKHFIVNAHSLLNLFITAVFPIRTLEQEISSGLLQPGVMSVEERLSELWSATEKSGVLEQQCLFVVAALDDLYNSLLHQSPKSQSLRQLVESCNSEKLAIILPKAYYADILRKDPLYTGNNIHTVTVNRFNSAISYDKIIVIGDIVGKRFDALKCKAAADIIVLLYECETHWFKRRKRKATKLEKELNSANGIFDDSDMHDSDESEVDENSVEQFVDESLDLEEFINMANVFDIRKFADGVTASQGNIPTSEVFAIGRFVGGEQIFFSKYYKAVVYNPSITKNRVYEVDTENLSAEDMLVFTKRDDFTKNIVDNIYDALLSSKKLSSDVVDATEKAQWWKEVLRDYQKTHGLSYRQLSKNLRQHGCTHTEVSIRTWLVEESHIVGPREEITLRQIAEMTQDPYLLDDTPVFFNACKIVRRQRKKILELIGKAIEDKLGGSHPSPGSELEIVYSNVESLSITLELESITFLNEPVTVPINFVNKPISDMEVLS